MQNTSCIRKPQVISGGGGGVRTPLHPPPRSAPVGLLCAVVCHVMSVMCCIVMFCCFLYSLSATFCCQYFHCEDLFLHWSNSYTGVNCFFYGANYSSHHVSSFLTGLNCLSHPIFFFFMGLTVQATMLLAFSQVLTF